MDLKIKEVKTLNQMETLIEQLASTLNQIQQEEWRRSRWRMTFETIGTVQVESKEKNIVPIYVTLQDISNEGVGFLSPYVLRDRQKIVITIETDKCAFKVPAIVKHSTKTASMFKIGAKFDLQ